MVLSTHSRSQRGIALVTAMLMLLLLLSLALGFTLLATSEQVSNGADLDRTQAFYAAYGAMERLNAGVGNLFSNTYAPTGAAIDALVATPPAIPGTTASMSFYDPFGGSGYEITYPKDANGNPKATTGLITQGQYQGFQGLITDYTITISVQSGNYSLTTGTSGIATTNRYGSEVRLRRSLQTVGIPVFQFGIFSQTDLSFFPGPPFNFGGVVATNGDLYLASGNTLTLSAQTSAFGDIIRDRLSNGLTGGAYTAAYPGTVSQTTSPGSGSFRNLGFAEGSINGGPSGGCPITGTGVANANWTTISVSNYNSALRDGAFGCARGTGARNLQLPLVTNGATGIDLIKLPPATENCAPPPVGSVICPQRYFTYPTGTNYAMLRILIADTAQEIMTLPTIAPATNVAGCPPGVSPCPVPMTPNTQAVPVNAGMLGGAKSLPKWAASQGGNTTPCSSSNPVKNCGDWFVAGWSRLGIGDNSTGPPGRGPYIKIEYQDNTTGGWVDKTVEILQLGFVGRNISNANGAGLGAGSAPTAGGTPATLLAGTVPGGCYEPHPDAVIRLQRLIDVPSLNAPCGYTITHPALLSGGSATMSTTASDYIPNMIFDAREGLLRDCWAGSPCPANGNLYLSGVMHYAELDVNNLSRWFRGVIGAKGAPPAGTAGYLLYFSDRRGNRVDTQNGDPVTACAPGACKLGNLGWEDFVNPASATGIPNNSLDTGEDLDGANHSIPGQPKVSMPLETYGGLPGYIVSTVGPYFPAANINNLANLAKNTSGPIAGSGNLINLGTNGAFNLGAGTSSPPGGVNLQTLVSIQEARLNPPLFFRRALKLTNAQSFSLGNCGVGVPCGLTITAENPVYVEGNYNAPGGSFAGADTPSAILADAVTLLSINWSDINSYTNTYNAGGRTAVTSFYRVAILAGKGVSFPLPGAGTPNQDFGTDGGVHNFLRYIESWGGGTLNYSGSIVSFFFNEQAVGTYKCCGGVYNPPNRGYNFNTNFLTPTLLPPRTPTFRDINTLGFSQLILPSQQ